MTTPALIACTDSTAPKPLTITKPLSLPEYALQLRGDPLLKMVSQMLGRPVLANDVDNALSPIGQPLSPSGISANVLVARARANLDELAAEQKEEQLTESDVLAAVITVTLDRISQVSGDSASTPQSSDPPPR
jgi:hypothetical protein